MDYYKKYLKYKSKYFKLKILIGGGDHELPAILPDEVLLGIINDLNCQEIIKLTEVNKSFRDLIRTNLHFINKTKNIAPEKMLHGKNEDEQYNMFVDYCFIRQSIENKPDKKDYRQWKGDDYIKYYDAQFAETILEDADAVKKLNIYKNIRGKGVRLNEIMKFVNVNNDEKILFLNKLMENISAFDAVRFINELNNTELNILIEIIKKKEYTDYDGVLYRIRPDSDEYYHPYDSQPPHERRRRREKSKMNPDRQNHYNQKDRERDIHRQINRELD